MNNLLLAEGFGLNTNIFETNLINLSVVIAVVVSFVGDALKSLLETRKQTILNNIQEANNRANEAQQRLNQARAQLEQAQKKAVDIREQGFLNAEREKNQCIRQTKEDILRLEETKQISLTSQQQKAINQISQKVIDLALSQVKRKLQTRLDQVNHVSVNNFKIALFTNYKG
jgi:F-type H+-transporting ATPase subunit b